MHPQFIALFEDILPETGCLVLAIKSVLLYNIFSDRLPYCDYPRAVTTVWAKVCHIITAELACTYPLFDTHASG